MYQRRQYDTRRPAACPIQAAAGKPRQDLPRWLVALLAAPELLFRVAALVVLMSRWRSDRPTGGLRFLAPAAMLHFLLNVTGIPPTEAQAVASRGEDYRQYQRTTSVFVPWFPKTEIHPKDNQEGK